MNELKARPASSPPLTPLTFLERAAVVYGDCTSIVYNSTTYTWSQTHRRCLQAASSIAALGIERGQVVSVVAPNIPAAYELHFAVPMAGAILNNINIRLNPPTISMLLQHGESKLVFVYHELRSLVLQALSLLPSTHPRPLLILISENKTRDETSFNEFSSTYEDLIQRGDPTFQWVKPRSDEEPITLNYTSGTTSSPKGVVHCHRATFLSSLASLINWFVPERPNYLWTLPMFHCNGWSFTWATAAVGGKNICLPRFNGSIIYSAITNHHVTHMCAAPVVLSMLANDNPSGRPLGRPVHFLTGGAPPPAQVLLKVEALGFVVAHGYGSTEIGGVAVSCAWKPEWEKLPPNSRARLKARQGVQTVVMSEINVIDTSNQLPVKRDGRTVGEIVLRGGCVMLGYLKDPESTSKCMGEDGWFRTGDLAVMHPDGYLEIKDRSKDIIISGGENISSVEVESVLYTIPGVNEAAVVAQPDEYWGETPCAFLSLKQGNVGKLSEKDVIEYCREKLPRYMVPKKVVFKEELPKTSTGKIQKFVLRDMVRAMVSRL